MRGVDHFSRRSARSARRYERGGRGLFEVRASACMRSGFRSSESGKTPQGAFPVSVQPGIQPGDAERSISRPSRAGRRPGPVVQTGACGASCDHEYVQWEQSGLHLRRAASLPGSFAGSDDGTATRTQVLDFAEMRGCRYVMGVRFLTGRASRQ